MHSITEFLNSLLASHGAMSPFQAIAALAVAYAGGVLSSLTPCVYPMIPITVSVVGGTAHTRGQPRTPKMWRDVLMRSGSYVAGMAIIYAFLGVVAGLTGKVFGSFTNNSRWYLGLGLIMSIAALMMLDIIPFDPAAWWERTKRRFRKDHAPQPIHHHDREMTLLGAFTLGASSGFIAAPCTTPVLTAILAFIAETQSIGLGLGLMLAFALGLGTLLLLIAAFTGALQMMPRSGNWMKTVKTVSGLLLLAFADYLIYRAGTLGGPQ